MNALIHPQTKKMVDSFLKKPAHATGLEGEIGAGKGFLADYLAGELLAHPCDKLAAHPYLKRLDCLENSIGIEQIRDLQKFLSLAVPGRIPIRRVVIIEYIENLSIEAQNALLKTLEETPVDTAAICTFTRTDKVLPTIHSRLQKIVVHNVSYEITLLNFEKSYKPDDIKRAFLISGGSAGLLHSLLENKNDHPLIKSINLGKETLLKNKFQRMVALDSMVKSKEFNCSLFLDGMQRILYADYKYQLMKADKPQDLIVKYERLRHINNALSDIESKVSQKLVLSKLLYHL